MGSLYGGNKWTRATRGMAASRDRCAGTSEATSSMDTPPKQRRMLLNLPAPPSVNRMTFTRGGMPLGNTSPKIKAWTEQADLALIEGGFRFPTGTALIYGRFKIDITFTRDRGDLDNRIKPLLDYLQRRQIIENDRLCDKITAQWGETKLGCQIKLE